MLLIDAGNTRVKWAFAPAGAAAGDWLASGACTHAELVGLGTRWLPLSPTRALLSNVAGTRAAAGIEAALAAAGVPASAIANFRSRAACAGVTNGYRQPEQLGCDRFASLIGARHRFPSQPLLVVTAGTATTIDALDASGRFIGGIILPGLLTMAQSLASSTAQLPTVPAATPPCLLADNTADAIASGCLQAQVGALLRVQQQLPGARCVLSGGAADAIAGQLGMPCERIDNLVLLGLHVVALSEA